MPEARAFGKRTTAAPSSPVTNVGAVLRGSEAYRLDGLGRRLGLAGELIGFGGLLLYLVSSIVAQAIQTDTYLTKVYIPPALQGAIDLTSPSIQMVDQSLVPVVVSLAWALIGIVGTIAMVRRRYLLGGLCAAALGFPWWIFGVYLPFAGIWAMILIGIAALRFFDPKGMALALSIVLGVVIGLPMIGLGAKFVEERIWPYGRPSVSYAVVDAAAFDPSQGRPVVGITRLPSRSTTEVVDRAFVLAQLATVQRDAASVVADLAVIDMSQPELNSFENWRLGVARNFAAHSGALGPEAKVRTDFIASAVNGTSLGILVVGVLLGLFGPFAGVIAGRATRRSQRIEAAETQLAVRRMNPTKNETRRNFGRIPSAQPLQSFAVSDATAVVGKMSRRIDIYSVAVLSLGALAVLAMTASFFMRLPNAASNAAFHTVDVNAVGGSWLLSKGLPVLQGMPTLESLLVPWLLGGLLVASITYRAKKVLGIAVMSVVLAGLVYWQVNSLFPIDSPHYAAQPSAFTSSIRTELESAAVAQGTLPSPGASAAEVRRLTQLHSNAPALGSGAAAFILAQLDYFDGNANDLATQLARVARDPDFRSDATTAEDQRLDLMQEWVATQGVAVVPQTRLRLVAPMAWVRASAQPLLIIGSAGGVLAILALFLSVIATRRSARLQELVAERQNISNRTAQP